MWSYSNSISQKPGSGYFTNQLFNASLWVVNYRYVNRDRDVELVHGLANFVSPNKEPDLGRIVQIARAYLYGPKSKTVRFRT